MKINVSKYGKILETVNVRGSINDMNMLPDGRYSIQTVKVYEEEIKDLPVLDNITNLELLEDEHILFINKDIFKIIKPLTVGTMLL